MSRWQIHEGDALERLREIDAGTVQTCITSPPYWGLRDYGSEGQLGLEPTPGEYVAKLVSVFAEVRRVLRDDGTLWLNLGDSYASCPASGGPGKQWDGNNQRTPMDRQYRRPSGLKPKDLVGIPWRVAFALQEDGWTLRSDIIWAKPNPMPESCTDRPTKAHEYLFLLSKQPRYYYDAEAIKEKSVSDHRSGNGYARPECISRGGRGQPDGWEVTDTRNRRTVWTIPSQPFAAAHFAVMPPALVEPCVLAGSAPGDLVLDPFAGSGTVGVVCRKHQRDFVGIELNPDYASMSEGRLGGSVDREAVGAQGELF